MFLRYEGESSLSQQQFTACLQKHATSYNWFGSPKERSAFFVGKIFKNSFILSLNGDRKLSVLYGQFSPTPRGTHVKIIMTFGLIGWFILLLPLLFSGLAILTDFSEKFVVSSLLVFFAYLVTSILSLFFEAKKTKKYLHDCLDLHDI